MQVGFVTTVEQSAAITRVAKERGISRAALLRDAVAAATGTSADIFRPFYGKPPPNGFASYNERRAAKVAARKKAQDS